MKKLLCVLIVILAVSCSHVERNSSTFWKVYFTTPGRNRGIKKIINPENGLLDVINSSKKSFYGAFYQLSSKVIVEALIQAKKRGVDVKIVTDSDNSHKKAITQLLHCGIPIVFDEKKGIMHHKFAIIDGVIVWTGSYNVTKQGAGRNNNNAIWIKSKRLAEIFMEEFNEMFEDKIFGNKYEPGPFSPFFKRNTFLINTTKLETYFSPEDNIEEVLIKRIAASVQSIHFLSFSFTSDRIGEAIIDSFHRGVKVYGLFESRGTGTRYSEYTKMKVEGIPVKLDRNRYSMHHKIIIIDGRIIIIGSYNYSKNANVKNDENIIIIENREISEQYLHEFSRLYN